MRDDNDLDLEDVEETKPLNRKKLLIFILPVIIVIGLSAGLFFVFNSSYNGDSGKYSVVKKSSGDGENTESITVFYDLPEVTSPLKHDDTTDNKRLSIRVNLEIDSIEDAKTIETLTPKIIDAIISHTVELTPQEVSGSSGLYWLKEELLYRINLITTPVKVSNLNFRNFEIIQAGNN